MKTVRRPLSNLLQCERPILYCSPTKIPNRDKKTESPYLVHPLTYRQVYLTKDAYFVEKIHCELVEMAVGQRMNKIRFSCHNIYWFGFLVTIRNFRRAPVLAAHSLGGSAVAFFTDRRKLLNECSGIWHRHTGALMSFMGHIQDLSQRHK